ncbi:MAG: tetratricopeptide repeat protein [Candidatus Margulisiibacteriota bacterium]
MRKILIFVILVSTAFSALALDAGNHDPAQLSIKAGPTLPGEQINMVWLESYIVPKEVNNGQKINLGVRVTSPVKSVTASFDFSRDKLTLVSENGSDWQASFSIDSSVAPGPHIARFVIKSPEGSIQRTVEFKVCGANESNPVAISEEQLDNSDQIYGWPMTVTSTCTAYIDNFSRTLRAGDKIIGISKVPWYKIYTEKGEEGWIEAGMVKEPIEEYSRLGYEAFLRKDYTAAIDYYQSVVELSPGSVKGYYWMAKCYVQLGNSELAYSAIKEAAKIDARNLDVKIFANDLAEKFFNVAHKDFMSGKYLSSVINYQKALDLKPASIGSWIELGQSYAKLDFPDDARNAWKEAIKIDPSRKEVYALLNLDFDPNMIARMAMNPPAAPEMPKPNKEVVALVADDSLNIVRSATTNKGTKIESALRSVIALTKSLGTPVVEKGWNVKKKGENSVVAYVCEQGSGVPEYFEFMVDVDSKRVSACNDNARLLMARW